MDVPEILNRQHSIAEPVQVNQLWPDIFPDLMHPGIRKEVKGGVVPM